MNPELPILVLAGGELSPQMQAVANGVTRRALIRLNNRPMLDYVVAALCDGRTAAGHTGRLLIAGSELPSYDGAENIPDGASMVDTLLSGITLLDPDERYLLVATADIPFLTGDAVCDFIERASEYPEADFAYPIVDAMTCAITFPGMRRTTLHLAEGEFTGGNLVLVNPAFLRKNEVALRRAYANRKNVKELAKMLGTGSLLRLMVARALPAVLPIAYVEKAVGRVLGGAVARAIVTAYPEIGADVDKPEDIPLANEIIKSQWLSP